MNTNVLIDSIVRQTTVLIAHLATAAGVRAPLTHTANQVFLDLVRELKEQGLGNRVIADMFGLALRTYQAKVRRLSESATDRGRSLWEALLSFVQERGTVTHVQILRRFGADDEDSVRGVLHDLVDSGLLFRTGRGDGRTYRAAAPEDLPLTDDATAEASLSTFVLIAIGRHGPVTRAAIAETVALGADRIDGLLAELVAQGRVREVPPAAPGDAPTYACAEVLIPMGDSAGWEAAVFDHYQAVVTAICTKLRTGVTRASADEAIGGSTYGFDVWDGHPMRDEVMTLLQEVRRRAAGLRKRVDSWNAGVSAIPDDATRVLFYAGQTVLAPEPNGDMT